jgi:hypothetical protein
VADKKYPLDILITATDKASAVIGRITGKLDRVTKPLANVRAALGKFSDAAGFSAVGAAIKNVGSAAFDTAQRVVAGLTAASAAVGFFIYKNQQAADEIGDTAERLNITTDALQAYTYGFGQADVEQQALNSSLDTLNKNLGLAQLGMGKAVKIFNGLGLDPKKFRTVDELLPAIADKLAKIENPAKRAAIANRLLGDAGAQMALTLAKGSGELERMQREAREAGVIIDASVIESAGKLDRVFKALSATFRGVAGNVLGELYPSLIKVSEALRVMLVQYQPQLRAFAEQFAKNLPQYVDRTGQVLTSLAAIVGTVASALVWCNENFGTTATVVGLVATTIGSGLTVALGTLTVALVKMGYAFAVAFPIPALIAAAVAGAVAAGWWLYSNWEKVSNAIGGTIEQIAINFSLAWEKVKSGAIAAFDAIWSVLRYHPFFLAIKAAGWVVDKVASIGGGPSTGTAGPALSAPIGSGLMASFGGGRQELAVKVDFANMPQGTRVESSGTPGMDTVLSRGYAMPGIN